MSSRMVKVSELQSGDRFKLSPRHRKEQWVNKVIHLDSSRKGIPKMHHGKILLVTWSCSQIIRDPDHEVFLVHSPKAQDHVTV